MPKVSPEHLDARRRGILKAAFRCFVRNGLHATTMRDICRAANLSPGAVYRYFDGKRAIVEALADRSRERLAGFFDGLGAADRSPASEVAALLEALDRQENLERLRLDLTLRAEALRDPRVADRLAAGGDAFVEALAGRVRSAQARGQVATAVDPETFARLALAMFEGLTVQTVLAADGGDTEPPEAARRMARELLVGALSP